jgi:hypothetical protein
VPKVSFVPMMDDERKAPPNSDYKQAEQTIF